MTIGNITRNNNIIELRNVRSTGLYTFTLVCKASNEGGSRTANATINILGKFFRTLNKAFETEDF